MAFGFGNAALENALAYGAGSQELAYDFGSSALSSVNDALQANSSLANQSMQFASAINASDKTNGASDMAHINSRVILGVAALIVLAIVVYMWGKK